MGERPIITLTSDFGTDDGYVGAMRGVILGICPAARIVDLSHRVAPQDIVGAALVLEVAAGYFPKGTIHLAVVDPGVGTKRRAVALRTPLYTFIGPDNGIFGLVWQMAEERFGKANLEARELREQRFFFPKVSKTFHGRDIFAPAAAHLALGASFEALGPLLTRLRPSPIPPVMPIENGLVGEIIHIDHFGNCISNIKAAELRGLGSDADLTVELDGHPALALSEVFSAVESGQMLALLGSSGHLELALRDGNLAEARGIRLGAHLRVINLR